jgi:hypothetical protein
MNAIAKLRTSKPPLQGEWGKSAVPGGVNTPSPVHCESSPAAGQLDPLLVHTAQALVSTALQELVQDLWDEPEEEEGQQIGEGNCPRLDEKAAVAGLPRVRVEDLELPEEVSADQASKILETSKHTVLRLLEEGLLEWRNAAPPSSSRPVYRITLRSVLELRTSYRRGGMASPTPATQPRRRRPATPSTYEIKHLQRKEPP